MPDHFVDLNLDQIVNALTHGYQEYNLKPFFYTPLHEPEAVKYRQAIFQDLEATGLIPTLRTFAEGMRLMRRYLGLIGQLSFHYHKRGWFLEAVAAYCRTVTELERALRGVSLKSRGLSAFRDYLSAYVHTETFEALSAETQALRDRLGAVRYCIHIKGPCVRVRHYDGESDYSQEVEHVFERFKRGTVKDYTGRLNPSSGMNYVEAAILDAVAKLHPELFAALDAYCEHWRNFLDTTLRVFDREIQFYLAYLDYIAGPKYAGLPFCYPRVSATDKTIAVYGGFDLALASKLVGQSQSVIANDVSLQGAERIIIVSGPNQGGKTTFARAFGQLHYLASLGVPIPGRKARLFLPDRIFTHFEREEHIQNLRGKLQDDLIRLRAMLEQATGNSLVVMNEVFASTTLNDAVFLSRAIMEELLALDLLCVCVTFIDELATLGPSTVSMVSTVVPENPAQRTFKIVRRPADGLAYAMSIVRKHRLTYDCIKERLTA